MPRDPLREVIFGPQPDPIGEFVRTRKKVRRVYNQGHSKAVVLHPDFVKKLNLTEASMLEQSLTKDGRGILLRILEQKSITV